MFTVSILFSIIGSIFLVRHSINEFRWLPRVHIIRRPRLFLRLAKELYFFETLFKCWKESASHTEYIQLPRATEIKGRDSGAILRTLYNTFHPVKIILQMQKIGHQFLKPLSNGRKRVFLKRILRNIIKEIPEAKPALKRAYWRTSWFANWNNTIHSFIRHVHVEIDREPKLRQQFEKLCLDCSRVIMKDDSSGMFIPDKLEMGKRSFKKTTKNLEDKSLEKIKGSVFLMRNGILGGIWYINRINAKTSSFVAAAPSAFSIPEYLNNAETSYFGHSVGLKSSWNGDNFTGFAGFPVIYIGGELYKQFLLLKQDKTDIATSLTFITIDAVGGGGGIVLASALAKKVGLASAGVGYLIYRGVRMVIEEVKKLIFQNALKKYEKFLRKREKKLFRAAQYMMNQIDMARQKEQEKLKKNPYNTVPSPPDMELYEDLIETFRYAILDDMEQMGKIGEELSNLNTSSPFTARSMIIQYRQRKIRHYIKKNLGFLNETDNYPSDFGKILLKWRSLPINRSSLLASDNIVAMTTLERYNSFYMLGLVNRVFSLYGLLQKSFASLVKPIEKATLKYDSIAKEWITKTQGAHRKLEVKAAQVGRAIPNNLSRPSLPLWEYRELLKHKNGKWTFE